MRVLHIIPRMVPTEEGVFVGGSVNALLGLIKETSFSQELVLYTHTDKGLKENFKKVYLKHVELHVYENWMRPGSILYGLYFLLLSIWHFIRNRAWGAEVIHAHSGFAPYALVTTLVGKILNKPAIHSVYCPIEIRSERNFITYLKSKLFYCSLIGVDKIVTMSANIRESLIRIGIPNSKIEVLPPFFDTVRFTPELRSEDLRKELRTAEDNIPIILFVGNLKHSKGLDHLVDALGLIVNDCDFRLVYTLELKDKTFDEKLNMMTERMERKGLSGRTTRLGIVESMPALMASSDLIVFPYRDTNGPSDYPIALLEAMASGIPTIATRVGGIPELVDDGKTGILVEPGDITGLAQGIKKMICEPYYRKKLGAGAREKSLEMLKKKNLRDEAGRLYNEISKKMEV